MLFNTDVNWETSNIPFTKTQHTINYKTLPSCFPFNLNDINSVYAYTHIKPDLHLQNIYLSLISCLGWSQSQLTLGGKIINNDNK